MELSGDGDRLSIGDDADLLNAVLRGDAAAFGRLYVRHARTVFAFCGRRRSDWDGAEDLTTVVFLHAWRYREEAFLVAGSLRPWLVAVATQVAAPSPSRRRVLRRHRAALSRFVGFREPVDLTDDDVAARTDRNRATRRARTAMHRLSRAHRQIVELCLLGGLSVAEAAEVLDVPLSTARTQLGDGRARLRRGLRSRDVEPAWLAGAQEGERRIGGVHLDRSRAQAR